MWVALDEDNDAVFDVTPLVLSGVDPYVFRLPVALNDVVRGDVIVTADMPFLPLFVLNREAAHGIRALDPIAGHIVTFVPPMNLFIDFVVVAVSFFRMV